MIPILCFVVRGRLKSATLHTRWSELDGCELFQLVTKWKGYTGGCSIPVAGVADAARYVSKDDAEAA